MRDLAIAHDGAHYFEVMAVLQAVWLPMLVFGLLACSALNILPRLLHSECEMTYMFSWPQYQKLNLSRELERSFPQYSLHLYGEASSRSEPGIDSTSLQLSGLPALFVPGNSGSHKQARSSASIALQMHRHEFPHLRHFDFFTVNLNEEFSGLFGGVLHRQTQFVAACIRHILSLYTNSPPSSQPSSVLIIAHSMGGVVAQALFTLPDFPPSLVPTIITLSSPLARPVVTFDPTLLHFYHAISEVWYNEGGVANNVTLVSVSGGDSDIQVPPHLTIPPSHHHFSHPPHTPYTPHSVASSAVPRNWVPADHRAIVWCRRLQLALSRALFLLQTPPTNKLTSDPNEQQRVLHHLLFRGWEIPIHPVHTRLNPNFWHIVTSAPHYEDSLPPSITALPLSPTSPTSQSLLVATNSDSAHWLYTCILSHSAANCTDLSPLASLLPPREKVVKYVHLSGQDLEGATHVVAIRRKTTPSAKEAPRARGRRGEGGREFLLMEWCERRTHSLNLPLWIWSSSRLHLPSSSHCTITNITLPNLTCMWTAHSATITSSCPGVKGGLMLPWLPHTPLLHDNGTGQLTIPLSLQAPVPDEATAVLLIWCPFNCTVTLSVSPSLLPLAGKLLVMYAPLLLPWVTAVAMCSLIKRQLLSEMALLAVIWGATSVGMLPGTDWEQLSRNGMWTSWGPLLIHLVARGLFQVLRGLLDIPTYLLWWCLPGNLRWVLALALMVLCLPGSLLCGAVGLTCVLGAYTLMAGTDVNTRHVQGLLACLLGLSLPSLFSWFRNIRYSLQLTPDPLFWSVGVASTLSIILLLLPKHHRFARSVGGCSFTSLLPLPPLGVLLSLPLLLYGTLHTYRLVYFSTAAILLTLITSSLAHLTPHQSHHPHTKSLNKIN